MSKSLKIRVPGTMANLGPGFDSFGLAVSLYNHFAYQLAEKDELVISSETTVKRQGLSLDPAQNVLFTAADKLYEKLGQKRPAMRIELKAHVPVARGLGSSSTAIIASLLAANRFAGDPLNQQAVLDVSIEIEHHPDNVAPALLGGAVFYDTKPYQLPWPDDWKILAVIPSYPLLTEDARKALPPSPAMADAIFNLRKASLLTYALLQADEDAFRLALEDQLHQPYRQKLIAEFAPLQALARKAGALGSIISGSGSTMGVFYKQDAEAALLKGLESLGTGLRIEHLKPDTEGAVFL